MINTYGLKYAGSKLKLLPYIQEITGFVKPNTVLDGFAGTTRVGQLFSSMGIHTTSNDVSEWSKVFGNCFLVGTERDLTPEIDYLNSLPGVHGWFTETYSKLDKMPFQTKNLMKLDAIRTEIDNLKLTSVEKDICLCSLLMALDKIDNTMGHFTSYLKGFCSRSFNELVMEVPNYVLYTNNTIVKGDVFDIIHNNYDMVYFDPPYGSNNIKMPSSRVRYNSYYHIWTSVILNDNPDVFGKVGRRLDTKDGTNPSLFEDYKRNENGTQNVVITLDTLIHKTNSENILLSYGSGGSINKQDLIDILTTNGVINKFIEIDYKKNAMAFSKITNEWINEKQDNYKEYMFLLKK